ncbi:MAG TPA: hemerythrin domain-containing protein [Acidimicrobiales bacterium]|nr:hemerythrin domain-containing protein [Acidimicrobiales bacterium]
MTSTSASHPPHSVIDLLLADHEQVERLFEQMIDGEVDLWPQRFCELRERLVQHEAAEEVVVYPALRQVDPAGGSIADSRLREQAAAEKMLEEMEGMDEGDPAFAEALPALQAAVLEHAEAEEEQVFPRLERFVDPGVLLEMGEKYQAAKSSAPTHPHPHIPNTPPVNRLLAPVAAVADRMRDAISR